MEVATIEKALEVWTLQNLLNVSIMLGILALGFALIQSYYKAVERCLTLRVSIEIWNAVTIVIVDFLLAVVMIVGFLVLNPDIMADIKVAIPFVPIATILFTIAFFLRIFQGGHDVKHPNFIKAIWFMLAGNVLNIVGFTFIMEAPSKEYLVTYPNAFWTFVKTTLRSNASAESLLLVQYTFYICFPILMIIYLWGFVSALKQIKSGEVK